MECPAAVTQRAKVLLHCVLILLATASVTHANPSKCRKVMDLVIAVDTTSSQTSASFEDVKTEVKGIVSGFKIGPLDTRLALISMSRQAQVVVNFDAVSSLADFNAAVDRLTFSTDTVDLAEGLKVAKDSVLSTARTTKTTKVVILVKDRRPLRAAVSGASVLTRMTSEAAGIRSTSATIHALGVGGLWNRLELNALYGTDYLLFKNSIKALDALKSLNHLVCEAPCPRKGTSDQKAGLCYKAKRHLVKTQVNLAPRADGFSVCRTEVERTFESCSGQQSCHGKSRTVGSCNDYDDTLTITSSWEIFDYKLQMCITKNERAKVSCADAKSCPGQVADVIFIVDTSGSVGNENMPTMFATMADLTDAMNVRADGVRVGLITYSTSAKTAIPLGSILDKSTASRTIRNNKTPSDGLTATDQALEMARNILSSNGRPNVPKYVFLITDGASNTASLTFEQTRLIKNAGVTLYVIGVGNIRQHELETMTAPETNTNLFIMRRFSELAPWVEKFSVRMCLELANPHPKLCEDSVFLQAISACTGGKQQVSRTEYKFDSSKNCIKTVQTTVQDSCSFVCVDPIDGNHYFHGQVWENRCHKFRCDQANGPSPVLVSSKCIALDGTCKDMGSQPFRCLVLGVETDNCRCLDKSGAAVITIDTE